MGSKDFVAHIQGERIQSVREHCENVAEYASQEAKPMGLSNTMRLAGLLHDIGKATHAFDDYIRSSAAGEQHLSKVNHSSAGGRYLYEILDGNLNNVDDALTCQMITYAVVSHHGLTDLVDMSGENCFENRLYPKRENFYDEAIGNLDFLDEKEARELFEKASSEIHSIYGQIIGIAKQALPKDRIHKAVYFMVGALQRLLLSFLIDADWRDTSEFQDGTRHERITRKMLPQKWINYQSQLDSYLAELEEESKGGALSELRSELSDKCFAFAQNGNGIYKLSIPTGGGKTLAGLRYALELARKEGKRHIYYVAPFLSILEQNAGTIKSILNDEEYVIEYHSNMIVSDEDETKNAFSADWSELVIMTTLVQLLNAMFSGDKKAIRRFHQLTDSIIIIDEAQSIPVKCMDLFTTMANFLGKCCHTTVVICTATQPLFEKIDYPLFYSNPADMIPDISKYQEKFKRTEIVNRSRQKMGTSELADMVLDVLDESILVILNTKGAVQKLYEEVKGRVGDDVCVFQLTTYMCAAHRLDRIEEIKGLLEEAGSTGKKIICVSTQLIEAGVDISFETVVRSLAGLDSIAQAAGRCNRNATSQIGNVYIVDYVEENVSRLRDIRCAQAATRLVMDRFQEELLGQKAMESYYQQYFFDRKDEMEYNVRSINDSLFELLSYNQKNTPSSYSYPMSQAFATAGEQFEVIEDGDTIGLIVPYKEAEEYIQELRDAGSMKEAKKYLKKLQRYTVNVYRNDSKLKTLVGRHAIDNSVLDGNVYILDQGFYGEDGLKEGMESMIF